MGDFVRRYITRNRLYGFTGGGHAFNDKNVTNWKQTRIAVSYLPPNQTAGKGWNGVTARCHASSFQRVYHDCRAKCCRTSRTVQIDGKNSAHNGQVVARSRRRVRRSLAVAWRQWARRNDLSPAQIMVKCTASSGVREWHQTGLVSQRTPYAHTQPTGNTTRGTNSWRRGKPLRYGRARPRRSVATTDDTKRPGGKQYRVFRGSSLLNLPTFVFIRYSCDHAHARRTHINMLTRPGRTSPFVFYYSWRHNAAGSWCAAAGYSCGFVGTAVDTFLSRRNIVSTVVDGRAGQKGQLLKAPQPPGNSKISKLTRNVL